MEQRDLDQCLRLSQSFLAIEGVVLREFCAHDFSTVKALVELDLVRM
jgi:hypothetical protein